MGLGLQSIFIVVVGEELPLIVIVFVGEESLLILIVVLIEALAWHPRFAKYRICSKRKHREIVNTFWAAPMDVFSRSNAKK